ncbi:ABC transporter ATP-binding protein [Azospirillum sp.]|uniref:ABC transporter ATP-binding protein n=1 Tax=Azospirillum sp. TaxID=34012 RepID=UPI002D3F705A|nr:ABC transporter ATP-binding protein [Azospirillum sp.]HYD65713.1 ABC transporter ATP-binding protein [Azospirillum sp.]
MLEVKGLQAAYGDSQVLFGMDLAVEAGQVVTLLGRNGMGKTTTIHTIMGIVRPKGGEVRFSGKAIHGQPAYKVARSGLGLVPEGRQIFPNLTVEENLVATATKGEWTLRRVYELFPRLSERRSNLGNRLSGGEQQMLAIGRALLTNPKLLILDEATEGLAPLIRIEIWRCLAALKKQGQAILVVDKNVDALIEIADRHFIVEKGRVVWQGDGDTLSADPDLRHRYLGV